MGWQEASLGALSVLSDTLSIAGVAIGLYTLRVARRVDDRVAKVRRDLVARVRAPQISLEVGRLTRQLTDACNRDDAAIQRELAKRIEQELLDLSPHLPADLQGLCHELASRARTAPGLPARDEATMKTKLIDLNQDLATFLRRIKNSMRDRQVGGEA